MPWFLSHLAEATPRHWAMLSTVENSADSSEWAEEQAALRQCQPGPRLAPAKQ